MNDKITLITQDGQNFLVDREMIAKVSETINGVLEDAADGNIPLPNVVSSVMKHCLEFAQFQFENGMLVKTGQKNKAEGAANDTEKDVTNLLDDEKKSKLKDFCDTFFGKMEQPMLFEVILAANYLDMNLLLDSCCSRVAAMIRGQTPDQIRKTFNIQNDFTPEEEEQVRKENEWVEA